MKKFYIFAFKIKRNIISLIFLCFVICLILFSSSNIDAAKSGLKLWASSVVPSLLPFFIAIEVLSRTNLPRIFGKVFGKIMKPLFNVSGEGSFAFLMGVLSGYPVGAKIAVNLRERGLCSKQECERLLSFTNNSGPLFIVGTVGVSLFGNTQIGLLLLFTHIIACITVGILFRFWKKNQVEEIHIASSSENKLQNVTISNLGGILGESINKSISTILMIGGFVVLFSVLISILNISGITNMVSTIFEPLCNFLNVPAQISSGLFTGILEITNGISFLAGIKLKQISINIILTSFLLGFGGISILFQVLSVVSKSDLSIKPYIIGKILHGIFAAIYTFLMIQVFPIFNFNLL